MQRIVLGFSSLPKADLDDEAAGNPVFGELLRQQLANDARQQGRAFNPSNRQDLGELHAPSKKVAVHDPAVLLAGCCAKRTDAWSRAGQRTGNKQLVRHPEIRCPIDLNAFRR